MNTISEVRELRQVLESVERQIGWHGSGPLDRDEYYCEHCKAPPAEDYANINHFHDCLVLFVRRALAAPDGASEPPFRKVVEWLHQRMAAAQNLPYEEGDVCLECADAVRDELQPLMAAALATPSPQAPQEQCKAFSTTSAREQSLSAGRRYSMVAVFSPNFAHLLLLRKPDTHPNPLFRGKWTMPGGFVEAGETEHQSAVRELFEETGITLSESAAWPILSFFCNCDPTEPEHEIFLYGATVPTETMQAAIGNYNEPVEVFCELPGESIWYLPQLRELAIARMKQPPTATQEQPAGSVTMNVEYVQDAKTGEHKISVTPGSPRKVGEDGAPEKYERTHSRVWTNAWNAAIEECAKHLREGWSVANKDNGDDVMEVLMEELGGLMLPTPSIVGGPSSVPVGEQKEQK